MGNNCCGSESNKERVLTIEKNEPARVREQDHAKRVAAMQASLNGVPITAGLKDDKQRVSEQDHAKRVAAMQESLTGVPVVAMTVGPEDGLQPSKGILPTARRASSDLSKTSPHYAEKLPTYKEALAAASRAANQQSTGKDLSTALKLPDEGSWI
jgi:hypothetical protein